MTDHEVIEGTAVEVYQHQPPAALFGTTDPVEVVEKATRVADALKAVIEAKALFSTISGRNHVLVEGWQLLGVMLGVTAVCVETEPVDGGYKATVEAHTAEGRVIGRADAVCTRAERTWKTRDDYALLSMAQTRATSKALKGPLGFVVSLAGYATTPADEMPSEPDPPGPAPMGAETRDELWELLSHTPNPAELLAGAGVSTRLADWLAADEPKIRMLLSPTVDRSDEEFASEPQSEDAFAAKVQETLGAVEA